MNISEQDLQWVNETCKKITSKMAISIKKMRVKYHTQQIKVEYLMIDQRIAI